VGRLIKKTLLNPLLTLPLLLATKYISLAEQYKIAYPLTSSAFNLVVYLGVIRWLNEFLNRGALSNCVSDTYDWGKEVVVVTGGSDGIGREVVKLLAASEVKVAVLDVQPLTYQAPLPVEFYQCDICSSSAIAKVASEIRSAIGHPTVLMNIAGVASGKTILDSTEAENRWVFEVNCLSHYLLAREFVPSMVSKNHGMVVTMASLASYCALANNADYSASKAAALAFHEGLTTELVTRYNAPKVRTLIITPGFVRTPLIQGLTQQKGFLDYVLEPETVAEGIVKRVFVGESGQLILPGFFSFVAPLLRAMPYWMSNRIRNERANSTRNCRARRVEDPDKKYAAKVDTEAT
jgi:all-trans-retinol dehydrogenase (NAD+)